MPYTPNNNPYIHGDPYSYDLKWIVDKINAFYGSYEGLENAIETLQTDFVDLKDYVDNFIDNVDIQTAVNNKLDEMYSDGSLAALIEDYIKLNLFQKNATIARVGRFIDRFGYDGTTRVLYGQACCFANNTYYVCGNYNSNANQTITVWNANGVLLNSAAFTTLGHANDICYLNGDLYVATQSGVAILDAATLTITNTFVVPSLTTVRCISTDGIYVYASGQTTSPLFGIVKYNPADGTLEDLILNLSFGASRAQGMEYHNGYFYFLYNEANSIVKINADTLEKVFIYNIPDNDGYFYTGELEDLLIVNDRLYLFSYVTLNETQADAVFTELFDSDVISPLESANFFSYMSYQTPSQLTLNGTATTVFNPTSTFNTAEELSAIVPNIEIIASNMNGGCYSNRRTKNVAIYSSNGITLKYIDMRGGNIILNNVNVNMMYSLGANINAHTGSITFGGCRFSIINALNCALTFTTTTERCEINFENSHGTIPLDISSAATIANTVIHIKGNYCSSASFTNYLYPAITSANGVFNNTYRVNLSGVFIDTTNTVSFVGAIGATLTNWANGFTTKTNEGYTINVSNAGVISATDKNGVSVTIASINNFMCTISNS